MLLPGSLRAWGLGAVVLIAILGTRVVKGGSWYGRPVRGTAGARVGYWKYQPVFNVGFRVVVEGE